MTGPTLRRGIRESKRFAINQDGSVTLEVTLRPAAGAAPTGKVSVWSTTAVHPGAILAVPAGMARADTEAFGSAWRAAATSRDGFQIVDMGKIGESGKLFHTSVPVIASWWRGNWFVRVGDMAEPEQSAEDAAIEVYVARDSGIVELELIGPYRPVTPGGANRWRETWWVLPSKAPDPSVLKRFLPGPG